MCSIQWKDDQFMDIMPRQWSRPETNVCWETTCRHTVTFASKVCCARALFKAKFLFRLQLNTLPTESETYNALVVMVCSGERSTRSTQRITESDTAQTERILTRLMITARPDSRFVSSHENRNNTAQHPCVASVPSCVVEPRVARTLSVVPEWHFVWVLRRKHVHIHVHVHVPVFVHAIMHYTTRRSILERSTLGHCNILIILSKNSLQTSLSLPFSFFFFLSFSTTTQ